MDQITIKFVGETPFLMHNNRAANPLDAYSIAISKTAGKRKKTIEDHKWLARLEWEAGLYLHDGMIRIPMRLVTKTIERGATKTKNGVKWKTGCVVMDDYCDFDYKGPKIKIDTFKEIPNPLLDKFFEAYSHQTIVKVGTASILRTRPIFEDWSFNSTIAFDPSVIDRQTLIDSAKDAGRLCGFGDWRVEKGGLFGKFSVEVID